MNDWLVGGLLAVTALIALAMVSGELLGRYIKRTPALRSGRLNNCVCATWLACLAGIILVHCLGRYEILLVPGYFILFLATAALEAQR